MIVPPLPEPAPVDDTEPDDAGEPARLPHLPASFWSQRAVLEHVRQAAHSRGRSPDAVLAAVLARVVADTRHTLRIPPIVGSACGLTILTAIAGPPGSGKSTSASIAADLIPARVLALECDGVPPGSGEGLIELLFDDVKEEDPDTGKPVTVHRQVHHNAFVYVDEGEVLTKLAGRQSASTLLPTLRSAFTGGVLGQANASRDRKRIVPAGQAVYGIVMGIQPELSEPLFDEAAAGTPQRILWTSATAPTPPPGSRPEWPGPLPRPSIHPAEWHKHERAGRFTWHEAGVPDDIALEVAERDHSRQQRGAEHLDEHSDLIQLKVAAALALLQGRLDLSDEDWHLAHAIVENSRHVRAALTSHLRAVAAQKEKATATRNANRQVEAAAATSQWAVVDNAKWLTNKVRKGSDGEYSRSTLLGATSRNRRDTFEDSLDHALAEGWLTERIEPGQGTEKKRLYPGERQP